MVNVLAFVLAGVVLSFGIEEDYPPKMVAVPEEIAKVLEAGGCECRKWKGINFCTGTEGNVSKEPEGILFFCEVKDKYTRMFYYKVPYSKILLYPSFID